MMLDVMEDYDRALNKASSKTREPGDNVRTITEEEMLRSHRGLMAG